MSRRPALSTGPEALSCRLQPFLPLSPVMAAEKILFALSQASPSVAAMIGRAETLNPGVRPKAATWV